MKIIYLGIILLLSSCANQSTSTSPIEKSEDENDAKKVIGAMSAGGTLSMVVMTSVEYCSQEIPKNRDKYQEIYRQWADRNREYQDMIKFTVSMFADFIAQKEGREAGENFIDQLQAGIKKTTIDIVKTIYVSAEDKERACEYLYVYNSDLHDIKNIKGYEGILSLLIEKYRNVKNVN